MDWGRELLGAGLVLVVSGLVIFVIETWTRRAGPPPELSRKLLHIGGITGCLLIPWLITSQWVVFVLSVAFGVGLWLGGRRGLLTSVSRVHRDSLGSACYPLAVFLVFSLSADRHWMYLSALLALGVADSMAAIAGSRPGRIRYQVEHGQKRSLEGSLVFLLTTFAAVLMPVMTMTATPLPNCLLAALLTSLLVTGFEAISLRGFDNLFVPIGVCIVLDRIVDAPLEQLLVKNLVLVALLVVVGLLVWRTGQLNIGAALVLVLFSYTAFALADWRWAIAPLVGILLYTAVRLAVPPRPGYHTSARVAVVVRILAPSLLVLALANATREHGFFQGAYVAGLSAATCFALRVYLARRGVTAPERHFVAAGVLGAVVSSAMAGLPWALQANPVAALAGSVATCSVLAVLHEFTLTRSEPRELGEFWTPARFLLSCLAALAIMLLQWIDILPPWPGLAGAVAR